MTELAPLNKQDILNRARMMAAADRGIFLDTACGGNQKLREEIERLLSDANGSSSEQSPAADSSRTLPQAIKVPGRLRQALRQQYAIQGRIGSGGMGDLYLATHKTLGGKWAIKVLAEDLAKDPRIVERFITEAKIQANLKHPNIVKVFNIGQTGGYHYFVMDYIEGEDLAERMERSSPLPESESVSIAFQICRALECAHDHSIYHRDLKPSNVRMDRYGTVFVLDFGIARARDVAINKTSEGERLGTPLYMSPEQIRGGEVDARSDLYSLGVLLYEMLTGNNPFQADSAHAVYAKHLNFMPPSPSEVNPRVKPALSKIVMALLEKSPDERIQSARELSLKLRPFREITEVTPSELRSVADTAIQPDDERMTHIVARVPETIISRELSPDESTVLQLINGKRTVREILALSQLDRERFFVALESLKVEDALQTFINPDETAEKPKTMARDAKAHRPNVLTLDQKWVYVVLLIGVVAILTFLFYRPLSDNSSATPKITSIQVDAAPFALVRIFNSEGKVIHEEMTPFAVALPNGPYSIEFECRGSKRIRNVQIDQEYSVPIRESFLDSGEIEHIVKYYLPEP